MDATLDDTKTTTKLFVAGAPITYPPIYAWVMVIVMINAIAFASLCDSIASAFLLGAFFFVVYGFTLMLGRSNAENPIKNIFAEKASDGIAVIGMMMFVLYLVTQHLVMGLLIMLLCMQAALLCKLKSTRELYFLFIASFVVLLFCVVETKNGFFIIIIMAYLVATTALLSSIFRQIKQTQSSANLDSKAKAGEGLKGITAVILIVASALYLALPRPHPLNIGAFISDGGQQYHEDSWYEQASNNDDWSMPGNKNDQSPKPTDKNGNLPDNAKPAQASVNNNKSNDFQYAGFNDSFSINDRQKGRIGNPIVLYVQEDRPLYLRGNIFNYFDGTKWSTTDKRTRKELLKNGVHVFETTHDDELIHQVIEVATQISNRLYGSPHIVELNFPGSAFAEDAYGNLYVPFDMVVGTRYKMVSQVNFYNNRLISDKDNQVDLSTYLQLPADLSDRVRDLANQVTSSNQSSFQKALLLESYLRNHYEYSLSSVFTSQHYTPIETFLFDTKKGHCEYFASSLAILLRTLHIPARLVTGFSYGNYNPITGYHELRSLDGHAWVEAWIDGVGWITFEPTPSFSIPVAGEPDVESTGDQLESYAQKTTADLKRIDAQDFISQLKIAIAETFVRTRQMINRVVGAVFSFFVSAITHFYPVLIVVVVLGVFGYIFATPILNAAALWHIKQLHGKPANAQARALWYALEAWLTRQGCRRKPFETVTQYGDRLESIFLGMGEPTQILATAFSDVNYGRAEVSDEVAVQCHAAFNRVIELLDDHKKSMLNQFTTNIK